MIAAYRYGPLLVPLNGRPPLVQQREVLLSHRETTALLALAKAGGKSVHCDRLSQLLGSDRRTPVKVVVSTLRSKLKKAGYPRAIARGKDGLYRLNGQPETISEERLNGMSHDAPKFLQGAALLQAHGIRYADDGRHVAQGRMLALPPALTKMLEALAEASPAPIEAEELARKIATREEPPSRRAVASAVWQLRQRLAEVNLDHIIQTRAKHGYRMHQPS